MDGGVEAGDRCDPESRVVSSGGELSRRGSRLLHPSRTDAEEHRRRFDRFGHGRRYVLHAYVVMPNHVHILITPSPGQSLAKIIGTIKGFTSREIHKKVGTSGELWQADYFDRFMRDEQHFQRTARYIELNPVKAMLVVDPTHWMESSASRPILELGSS